MNIKNEAEVMTDDETVSYFNDVEENEPEEPYELKHKLFDLFMAFDVFFTCIGCLLLIGSFFISWDVFFDARDQSATLLPLRAFVLFCGLGCIGFVLLGLALSYLSMEYLKITKGGASYCYYFNIIAYHISALIVFLSLYLVLRPYSDFVLIRIFENNVCFLYTIRLLSLEIVILATIQVFVQYVSVRFNYNMYIAQIRKCLLCDLFVSLVCRIHRQIVAGGEGYVDLTNMQSSFVLQTSFRCEDASTLTLSQKRLMIKTLLNLASQVISYTDSLPTSLAKIKAKARNKADKLYNKLQTVNKLKKIEDMQEYFVDQEIFLFMLKQLGLSRNHSITRESLYFLIQKTYKSRYVIQKNLSQMNRAILRFHRAVKYITCFLTALFIVIKETIRISHVPALVSAFFGTQFISNLFVDNVIQSVVFLFIIHPFDVGDRVFIRFNGEEENFLVGELNILSTLLYKYDNTSYFVPNRILIQKPVCNIRRSGALIETHLLLVNTDTRPEKLSELHDQLVQFCRANPENYTDYVCINYEKIEDNNRLLLKVVMQHRTNSQHFGRYLQRRSEFVNELSRSLKACKIKYKLPVQHIKIKDERNSKKKQNKKAF